MKGNDVSGPYTYIGPLPSPPSHHLTRTSPPLWLEQHNLALRYCVAQEKPQPPALFAREPGWSFWAEYWRMCVRKQQGYDENRYSLYIGPPVPFDLRYIHKPARLKPGKPPAENTHNALSDKGFANAWWPHGQKILHWTVQQILPEGGVRLIRK